MQPVTADQREEGGKKCAALRGRPRRDHVVELAKLEIEKCRAQQERHHGAEENAEALPRIDGERHQPAAVAGEQEKSRLHRCGPQIEQLRTGWTACSRLGEHGVGRKQRREHHDVAQQEDPEAKACDDSLGCRTRLTDIKQFALPDIIHFNGDIHSETSTACVRSNWPTCSAEISTSSSTRNMKASSVTVAPKSPTPAIHQMCQIRAK